jgi:hypothetical protein
LQDFQVYPNGLPDADNEWRGSDKINIGIVRIKIDSWNPDNRMHWILIERGYLIADSSWDDRCDNQTHYETNNRIPVVSSRYRGSKWQTEIGV